MEIFKLYATLSLKTEEFESGIAKASDSLKRINDSENKTISAIAKSVAAAGTAVYGLGIAAGKAGIDYERTIADVYKSVDATDEQYKTLSDGIREMSKEMPMAAKDIAVLVKSAGELGIETENVLEFSRVIANLGATANIAGQEGAEKIARFADAIGMSHEDFDRLGSAIVALGKNYTSTEAEILEMAMCLADAGAQIGISEADVLGLATALSCIGIEAEAGGSAISKIFISMSKAGTSANKLNTILDDQGMSLRELQTLSAVNASTFNKLANSYGFAGAELESLIEAVVDFEEFALVAGMTGGELARVLETDALSALQAFINGLAETERSGNSIVEMLREMGTSEADMHDVLLRMANGGSLLAEALKLSGEAWDENTALTEEAEKIYGKTAYKLEMLKNRATDVGASLLEMTQPIVLAAVEAFSCGLTWLSENLGIVLPVVSALTIAVGGLSLVMNMGKMMTAVTAAWQAFNLVLAANPIGIIITLVAALVMGIITLWNTNEGFRNAVLAAWEAIKSTAENVWGGIARIFTEDVPNAIDSAVKWFSELPGRIWEAVKGIQSFGKNVVDGFVQGVKDRIGWAKDKVNGLFSGITSGVKSKLGIASPSKVFAGIGKFTGEGFVKGLESMSGVVDRAMGEVFGARDFAVMPAAGSVSLPSAPRSAEVQLGQETQAAGGTAQIIVQNMSVRDDSDIQRIARELYLLQERRRRGMAVLA